MSTIVVGLSGGVDSSVSAYLLQQQGFDVIGVFMKNWEEDDTETYCSATQDIHDAQQICSVLGIPFHTVNFAAEYWDRVFEYFLAEYRVGRTPNPDILCNREIKFKAFLDYAKQLGVDQIATGHYAHVVHHPDQSELLRSSDTNKDQTYFLYALNQKQLQSALFPLASLTKPEVRKIADKLGFVNHQKKDSTGICFIGERKFKDFLQQYCPNNPGPIVSDTGQVLGEHQGLMFYTLGQRQGIGIGGVRHSDESPWYVLAKDLSSNTLLVGQGIDHPALYKKELTFSQANWINTSPNDIFFASAKIRHRQPDQSCRIEPLSTTEFRVYFDQPQRAITPGQSIVLYDGNRCIGGGVIEN